MFCLGNVRRGLLLALAVVAAGCSDALVEPDLGTVTGSVKINGQPAPDVMVQFEPKGSGAGKANEVGATSTGITDAGGNYELTYKGETKGAVVGMHTVRLTSAAGGGPAGGEAGVAPVNIPANFNIESSIEKDVQKGENKIDIEITTK